MKLTCPNAIEPVHFGLRSDGNPLIKRYDTPNFARDITDPCLYTPKSKATRANGY